MAIVMEIQGMHCGGCVSSVRKALARAGLPVETVEVGRVTLGVTAEDAPALARAREAIDKAGFEAGAVKPAG